MSFLEAALAYRARDWAPIPLRGKVAAVPWRQFQHSPPSISQVRAWWTEQSIYDIGLVMGAASGNLVAVDIDPRHGGKKSIRGLPLPPTFVTHTGGNGWHCIYKTPMALPKRTGALPGVDLIGQGGYVVAPPSLHPSGKLYKIVLDEEVAPAPGWVVEAMRLGEVPAKAVMIPGTPHSLEDGVRHENLFKMGCGFMRGACAWCGGRPCQANSQGHLFKRLAACNKKNGRPPLTEGEVWIIATNAWKLVRTKVAIQQIRKPNGLLLT